MFHTLNIWALSESCIYAICFSIQIYSVCVLFLKITTQLIESRCRSRCLEMLPTPPLRPWREGGCEDLRLPFPQRNQAAGFDMQEPLSWDLRSEAALLLLQQPCCASCEPSSNQAGGCRSPFPPLLTRQFRSITFSSSPRVPARLLLHLLALLSVARAPILSSLGGSPAARCCLLVPQIIPDKQPSISGDGSTGLQARGGFHQRYYCCDVS